MPRLTDYQAQSVSRALGGNLGVEESPEAWKSRLEGMIDGFIGAHAAAKPDEPRLDRDGAWERMCVMLRALGADV